MTHGFEDVKKILVIKLRHIGDVLLTVPVFRALRENFLHAHIAALVNSGTEEVLTGNPLINEIIVLDRGVKKMNPAQKYLKELSFLKMIRTKWFDMAVDLTSGDRAAIISFVSGARYRLAYDPGNDGFIGKRYLYTHLAKKDGSKHMVLQNLDIVSQFGINTDNLTVDIFIPEDAKIFVKKIFEENNINKNNPPSPPFSKGGKGGLSEKMDKVVHVHPTSRWLFKCWKDENMVEVISWLVDRGLKVIVTSSPDNIEMEKAKGILSHIPHLSKGGVINLCGKTSIKQLAAISESSDLFLGIDSAPMHIAAAVGTPVIALFGPTGDFNWSPWYGKNGRNQHAVIKRDWDCIPCGRDGCNTSKISKCLEDIKPSEIKDILKGYISK